MITIVKKQFKILFASQKPYPYICSDKKIIVNLPDSVHLKFRSFA